MQEAPDSERAARYGSRDEPGHCSLGVSIERVAGHRRASRLAKRSQNLGFKQARRLCPASVPGGCACGFSYF